MCLYKNRQVDQRNRKEGAQINPTIFGKWEYQKGRILDHSGKMGFLINDIGKTAVLFWKKIKLNQFPIPLEIIESKET